MQCNRMRNSLGAWIVLGSLAACGGGGGGGGTSVPPSTLTAPEGGSQHSSVGLISAVPADQVLRLEWRADSLPAPAPSLALFVGTDENTLLAQSPLAVSASSSASLVSGLTNGLEYFAVLAIQEGGQWFAAGPTLRAMPRAPLYVRSDASGQGADGRTPLTAFPTIEAGILQAQTDGGGNLWIAAGTYGQQTLRVPAGVRLYGGFEASFDLAQRNAAQRATQLNASGVAPVLFLERADGDTAVVDGLRIHGAGVSEACVEVDQRATQACQIFAAQAVRGFKLRSLDLDDPIPVSLVDCTVTHSSVGGVSIDGAFAFLAEACTFRNNLQEGVTADDLLGLGGEVSRFTARDCLFAFNGSEGLDIDMVAAAQPSTGRWVILVEDCEFVSNGFDGCLIDADYEASPGWTARVEVRGCVARHNGLAGLHMDLDASSSAVVHRCALLQNQTDGLWISSETAGGMVSVSASELSGNQGFGARSSLGNVGLALSHCVLSGNGAGGVAAQLAPASAVSSIAYLQPNPWSGVQTQACWEESSPNQNLFQHAPQGWARVVGWNADQLQLAAPPGWAQGDTVEVAADGVPRMISAMIGAQAGVTPAPSFVPVPAALTRWVGASVEEDWRPAGGSPLLGQGMGPVGGPTPDGGPFGAPRGGGPGAEALRPMGLFRLALCDPSWTTVQTSSAAYALTFEGGDPDLASLASGIECVDAAGNPLAHNLLTPGNLVLVEPPGGGWPVGARIRLHTSLRNQAGEPIAAPLVLPLSIQP